MRRILWRPALRNRNQEHALKKTTISKTPEPAAEATALAAKSEYGWGELKYTLFIYSLILVCYLFFKDLLLDWDEPYYQDFVNAIKKYLPHFDLPGIFALYRTQKFSGITSLPLYHIVLAGIAQFTDTYQVWRLAGVACLLILVLVFSKIQLRLYGQEDFFKQLSFVFFPIAFTHAFLLYTDYPALFLVILAFYFEVEKKHWLSALTLAAGFCTRQSVAPWLILVPMIGQAVSVRSISAMEVLATFTGPELKKRWLHIAAMAGIIAFVMLNHGVSMGDKQAQGTGKFSLGNIFIFYLFAFFFFLPGAIANIKTHTRELVKDHTTVMILLGAFACFMFLYGPGLHFYNTWLTHRDTQFFVRNNIVYWTMHNIWWRVLAFACAVIGFLELNRPVRKDLAWILTAASIICVAPFNVTDVRYAMVPFAFYVILRNEENPRLARVQAVWLCVISFTWFWAVRRELCTPF